MAIRYTVVGMLNKLTVAKHHWRSRQSPHINWQKETVERGQIKGEWQKETDKESGQKGDKQNHKKVEVQQKHTATRVKQKAPKAQL